jgi:hypothetical protein
VLVLVLIGLIEFTSELSSFGLLLFGRLFIIISISLLVIDLFGWLMYCWFNFDRKIYLFLLYFLVY